MLRRRRPTRKVAAFCTTEPEAGSDVGAMRTRAVYDEATDEWVLNGQKAYATNGGIADVHVVTASRRPDARLPRPGGVRRPAGHPRPGRHPEAARSSACAPRTPPTSSSTTYGCPGRCLLGGKEALDERLARARSGQRATGQAAMRTFELSRPTVGAQALGIARAAYEYALDYAKDRVQFGRPIIENQAIAFALADMRMEIDAARLLVWRAAWMGRNNRPFTAGEGSMSKLKAGEVAVVGHREGGADPRRRRLPARPPGRALVPRRQDLHHLRGHLRDPATGHLPGDLRDADPLTAVGPTASHDRADGGPDSTICAVFVTPRRRQLGLQPRPVHDQGKKP